MRYTCLCLHVEKLHDERVWRRLRIALDRMDERGLKATFLVYPLRSRAAGADIRERVRELAARGHDVGQHTHFYVGGVTERPHKQTDLSDRNVRTCILRDYEFLAGCGVEPKGFCAGNFMTTETVFETLAELGFLYDSSARLPWERRNFELPHLFADGARVRVFDNTRLVLLPNTDYLTVAQYLYPSRRERSAPLTDGQGRYQLIGNHDYDLLIGKVWLALRWRIRHGGHTVTARQLAELCLKGAGDEH
jgi:hypothetical protein